MDVMIDVEDFTAFETAADGATTCLTLRDTAGSDIALRLSLDGLNSLMAALPRMLTEARRRLHDDPNLRIVYPVEDHRVERADDPRFRIVTLVTRGTGRLSYRMEVDRCRDIAGADATAPILEAQRRLN